MRFSKYKFVIFEWTIPLSTKWNKLSNCAILSVSLVPIQLWGETGYLVHLVGVHQDFLDKGVQDLLWFESFCFHQFGKSQQYCPCPTAQASVTEPGPKRMGPFLYQHSRPRPVPILLQQTVMHNNLLCPNGSWNQRIEQRNDRWGIVKENVSSSETGKCKLGLKIYRPRFQCGVTLTSYCHKLLVNLPQVWPVGNSSLRVVWMNVMVLDYSEDLEPELKILTMRSLTI